MMGTILAYITFGGSMFDAVYLLLHKKPIQSLATLIVALGSPSAPRSLRRLHPTQAETTKSTAADAIVIAWRASRGASKGTFSGTDRSWRRGSRILVVQNRLGYHNGNRAGGCRCFGKSGQREKSGQCRACSNASPLWTKEAHFFTPIMTLLGKWRLVGNGVHHSSLLASYVLRLQVC
jgi:hypothetical protein